MYLSSNQNPDVQYKGLLNYILTEGTDTSDGKVRPIWEDTNEPAYTIKGFGAAMVYDLRNGIPVLTCRRIAIKSALDEILWIYQKKSNNIAELNSHIWDQWATEDENGKMTVGKTYGWQVGNKFRPIKTTLRKIRTINPKWNPVAFSIRAMGEDAWNEYINKIMYKEDIYLLDQMDYILHEIKYNPYSRHLFINLIDVEDIPEMNLVPCCHQVVFNVTKDKDGHKVLNMELNQRSLDTIVAGGWDVTAHALLLQMVANSTGCIAGELKHNITDPHIYDRHIHMAKKLINAKSYDQPDFVLEYHKGKTFYDYNRHDITINRYEYDVEATEFCGKIPVAK